MIQPYVINVYMIQPYVINVYMTQPYVINVYMTHEILKPVIIVIQKPNSNKVFLSLILSYRYISENR